MLKVIGEPVDGLGKGGEITMTDESVGVLLGVFVGELIVAMTGVPLLMV